MFDNCFTLNFAECQPMCVIRNPRKKVQIEIHPERSYPYLQIYTPDHRKSIAIENLSGAPDAFNNGMGLKVLAPGETANFTTNLLSEPYNILIMSSKTIVQTFAEKFGTAPRIFFSPGRINLIGEHIDYNDGYVMPAATDKGIWFAVAPNNTDHCQLL